MKTETYQLLRSITIAATQNYWEEKFRFNVSFDIKAQKSVSKNLLNQHPWLDLKWMIYIILLYHNFIYFIFKSFTSHFMPNRSSIRDVIREKKILNMVLSCAIQIKPDTLQSIKHFYQFIRHICNDIYHIHLWIALLYLHICLLYLTRYSKHIGGNSRTLRELSEFTVWIWEGHVILFSPKI